MIEESFQQQPHPIPLITYKRGDDFEINTQESYNVFDSVNDKEVAVIMVAGEARSGKSFLANRLLGRQNGFALGANVTACTKGIWIWSEPIPLKDGTMALVMDCEGLNSVDKESAFDTKLMTLALLLSSTLVFNQKMVLSADTFVSLAKVATVAKGLLSKSGARPDQLFPKLMVVLRDFQANIAQDGFKSTKDYFESALKENSEDTPGMIGQKRVIKECFSSRDCTGVVMPVVAQQKLRHVENMAYEELRAPFRDQMDKLIEKVRATAVPKYVKGQAMNGSRLKELAYSYIEAINAGETPYIPTTLERVLRNETRQASENQLDNFRDELDVDFDAELLPIELEEEEKLLWDKYDTAVDALHKRFAHLLSAKGLAQEIDEFGKKCYGDFEAKQQINYDQSAILSNHLLESLKEGMPEIGQEIQPDSFLRFFEDWHHVIEEYLSKAVGTAKTDFLSDFIFDTEQLHNQMPLESISEGLGAERGGSKIMDDDDLSYHGRVHLGYHDSVGPVVREKQQLLRIMEKQVASFSRELEGLRHKKDLGLEKARLQLEKLGRDIELLKAEIQRKKVTLEEKDQDKEEIEARLKRGLALQERQELVDKEELAEKERDLKLLNQQLADKNSEVEKLRLQTVQLSAELETETGVLDVLMKEGDKLEGLQKEAAALKQKADNLEPLVELKSNPAYRGITAFFSNLEEELANAAGIEEISIADLEARKAKLQQALNQSNRRSEAEAELQEAMAKVQDEHARKVEALQNEMRGLKSDKQRLEQHLKKSANQVEKLQQELRHEEDKFQSNGERTTTIREQGRKLTHDYHLLENDINQKRERLQKVQEDITIESLRHCNLLEDNSELLNLIPLLRQASAMNKQLQNYILKNKFQPATVKRIQSVAGKYFT